MNRAMWSAEERAEYDAMVRDICLTVSSTEERVDLYQQRVEDAVQAQRFWAQDATRDAYRTGCREQLTAWLKSNRIVVQIKDRAVSKPRTIGVKRKAADGEKYDAQVMFDVITWDELAEKRRAYLKELRAYSDNVAVIDRLLALHEMVPEATTPGEALRALGESLDDYLGRAA